MRKGIKFRLYPTTEQINQLNHLFGCTRYVYNKVVQWYLNAIDNQLPFLTYDELKRKLYYHKKSAEGSFLLDADPIALTLSLRNFDQTLHRYLQGKGKEPRFKMKSRRQSYTLLNKGQIYIEDDMIYVPKLGRIKFVKTKDVPNIQAITISRNSCNQYFVSINSIVTIDKLPRSNNVVGIDVGIHVFCTTSNHEVIENPRYLENYLKRLVIEQKRLSKMQKGSNNYIKQCLKIAKIHQNIKNQREDFLHQLSTKIIRENQIICVENLDIKSMLQNPRLAKSISSVSWGLFFKMLEYKANWYGRTLIKIDTYFPSSQTCSCCGFQNKELKDLSVRHWICPQCRTQHDRDLNASINILNKGLKQLK